MEGNEIQLELNSFSSLIHFLIMATSSQTISSLCSDPLFSCVITLYTLILIFYPCALKFFLSPVVILTSLLLLFLLRLGAGQRFQIPVEKEQNATIKHKNRADSVEDFDSLAQINKWVKSQAELGFQSCRQKQNFEHSFIEWNVRAPLEVIYEAHEGEEDDQDYEFSTPQIQSLSMYYPETDSDSSSDGGFEVNGGGWDSPESVYLKWEEEDKEGMLIEIALDTNGKDRSVTGFRFEEDNLIEIDISPRGNDNFNSVLV